MTIKPLFVCIIFLLATPLFSQEMMTTKDGAPIPATETWDFLCENYALTGTAKVQIAKDGKGGVLKIAVQTTDPSFFIGGVAYVYLEDNTIIVCTDKRMRTNKDNVSTVWYTFSTVEMNKLKTTNIGSIRFSIRGNPTKFSSQTGTFTAVNKKSYFSVGENKPETYPTATQITALYHKP
ncbi:hypothetical protein [Flavobacterium sp.]|uniref:hypothetical protein n=1 Tax=Flavobacterium sp. TaxID=239 RepID=UPI0039E29F29